MRVSFHDDVTAPGHRAAELLTTASTRGPDIGDVTQHEVDARPWDNPGTRDEVRDFVVRADRSGHSRALGCHTDRRRCCAACGG